MITRLPVQTAEYRSPAAGAPAALIGLQMFTAARY